LAKGERDFSVGVNNYEPNANEDSADEGSMGQEHDDGEYGGEYVSQSHHLLSQFYSSAIFSRMRI
jgi:hypothetical protein